MKFDCIIMKDEMINYSKILCSILERRFKLTFKILIKKKENDEGRGENSHSRSSVEWKYKLWNENIKFDLCKVNNNNNRN